MNFSLLERRIFSQYHVLRGNERYTCHRSMDIRCVHLKNFLLTLDSPHNGKTWIQEHPIDYRWLWWMSLGTLDEFIIKLSRKFEIALLNIIYLKKKDFTGSKPLMHGATQTYF